MSRRTAEIKDADEGGQNAGAAAGRTRPPVPDPLAIAAAWSWRLLIVAAAVVVLALALAELRLVVLPVLLAVFATALLREPAEWLKRHRAPPALAAVATLVCALGLLVGVLAVILPAFVDQLDQLGRDLRQGVEQVGDWLIEGPLGLSENELEGSIDRAIDELRGRSDALIGGVLSGAVFAVELAAGLLLALVLTFFFLKDGDRIWNWLVGLLPAARRHDAREIGARAWRTLAGYLRGVTVVALVEAVFIGLALVLLSVPAALPLAVFTFFGAYVPIAGAVVAGTAAVLVALVSKGVVIAAAVAAAVIIVQQLEGNVLQPVVVGRAVDLHPVAILLAVTSGAVLAGVIGALVAVPIAAVAARVGEYLRAGDRPGELPSE